MSAVEILTFSGLSISVLTLVLHQHTKIRRPSRAPSQPIHTTGTATLLNSGTNR